MAFLLEKELLRGLGFLVASVFWTRALILQPSRTVGTSSFIGISFLQCSQACRKKHLQNEVRIPRKRHRGLGSLKHSLRNAGTQPSHQIS